mgnify:CR=1 FL=1
MEYSKLIRIFNKHFKGVNFAMRQRTSKVIIPIIIFTISLLTRLPYSMQYPIFRTDELGENLRAYAIVNYNFFPLTNNAPFIGALYNYLVALIYFFIPSIISIRLFIVILGSLTPLLIYFLALKLCRSVYVSLLASLILALSPAHILITSHVAWSASLVPLLFALSLYVFMKALKSTWKWWFILGILVGLTIQAHPSSIASIIAFLISYALFIEKSLPKILLNNIKFWFPGLIIGYINMVLYNIIVPLGSITAVFKAPWTGLHGGLTIFEFIRRFVFLITEYVTMIIAGIPVITLGYLLQNIFFYVFITLLIIIVSYSLLKRSIVRSLALYTLLTLLILSIGTKGIMSSNIFGFTWGPHYLQQLLPLHSILIAESLSTVYKSLIKNLKKRMKFIKILSIVMLLFIVIVPSMNLVGIYSFVTSNKCVNKPFLDTIYGLKKLLGRDTPIFIDVYSKYPPLFILYQLAILENLNIYPRIKYFVERPTKIYNIESFLKEIEDYDKAVLILKPQDEYEDYLSKYQIMQRVEVKGCFQKPLYRVLVISIKHEAIIS